MIIKFATVALIITISIISFSNNKVENKTPNKAIIQNTGKQIFMINCGTCHHAIRQLTGPTIYGVRSRWSDKKLLYKYVRNSQEVIKTNAYAKALFIKWNKTVMTAFPKLSDAEIESIFNYVDEEAKKKGLL